MPEGKIPVDPIGYVMTIHRTTVMETRYASSAYKLAVELITATRLYGEPWGDNTLERIEVKVVFNA